jgi:hypothetical protein
VLVAAANVRMASAEPEFLDGADGHIFHAWFDAVQVEGRATLVERYCVATLVEIGRQFEIEVEIEPAGSRPG